MAYCNIRIDSDIIIKLLSTNKIDVFEYNTEDKIVFEGSICNDHLQIRTLRRVKDVSRLRTKKVTRIEMIREIERRNIIIKWRGRERTL